MTTLDFNWKPKIFTFDKEGVPEEEEAKNPIAYTIGVILGDSTENKEKFYDWHIQLYLNKKIVVDDTDKKLLRSTIASSERLPAQIGGQILKYIDTAGANGTATTNGTADTADGTRKPDKPAGTNKRKS